MFKGSVRRNIIKSIKILEGWKERNQVNYLGKNLKILNSSKNNNKMKNKRKKMNNIFNFRKKVPVKLVQEIVKIVKLN